LGGAQGSLAQRNLPLNQLLLPTIGGDAVGLFERATGAD
jgi:hypothetical protein